ncbi:hypothetical protein PMAYCL1PPCAC_10619, partial [Pristionchus mayeri]
MHMIRGRSKVSENMIWRGLGNHGHSQLNDSAALAAAGVVISKKVLASLPVRGLAVLSILFAAAAVALGSVKRLMVQPFFAYAYAISTLLVAVATVAPE